MKKMNVILALLVVALARPFYVMAGEACGPQADLRGAVPVPLVEPVGLDPVIYAASPILPPVRTDTLPTESTMIPWNWRVGKLNRTGPYCVDPNFVLKKIECVTAGSSSSGSITVDPNMGTWTLATTVTQGPNWWLVLAVEEHQDDPSVVKENSVLVMVWGDAPVVSGVRLF